MHVVKLLVVLLLTAVARAEQDTAIDDFTSLLQHNLNVKHSEHGEEETEEPVAEEHHQEAHEKAPAAEGHHAAKHASKKHKPAEHPVKDSSQPQKPWWHNGRGLFSAGPPDETHTRIHRKTVTTHEYHEHHVFHMLPMQLGNPDCQSYMYLEATAEFIGTGIFTFIVSACWMAIPTSASKNAQISLVSGLSFAALYYALWHYSCGVPQLNMAISFALSLNGVITFWQAWVNTLAQVVGSIVGSMMTIYFITEKQDQTHHVGANEVSQHYTWFQAWYGEFFCTMVMIYVYLETNICDANQINRQIAALAVGAAVTAGHGVLCSVDRCSMNPSKSFGPMTVKKMFRPGEYYTLIKGQHDTDKLHGWMHEETGSEPYYWQYWTVFLSAPMIASIFASTIFFMMAGEMDGLK